MKSIRYRLTVSIAFLAGLASFAPAQVWTSHGPTGAGVVYDLAVGDGVGYAATPTGVFLSRDGGATWIPSALAGTWIGQVVARAGATVALAVAPSTLYSTRDGGNTWTPIPGIPSMTAAIDPRQPSTLYSGAYAGIWRSTDSGASWQRLSTAPTGKVGISFAFDSHAIYILDFDEHTNRYELHQSLDGGDSWAGVSTPIPSPTAVAGGAVSGLVYVGGAGNFCRSADSAATWTCSSFASAQAPFLVREVPGDGSTAGPRILAISDAGAYLSSDGATWAPAAVELDSRGVVATFASDASGSLVLAGTNVGIFRSSDRGDSWTPASAGLRSSAINVLALDPQEPSTVWAVGNGFDGKNSGLFRSRDGGLTWSLGSGPQGSFDALLIDPAHPSTLYLGGSTVSRSIDSGANWTSSPLPGGGVAHSLAVDPALPERVWAASESGLFRSDDGAESWTSPPAIAQAIYSLLFDDKRPGTMYAGSYFEDVDGGYYPGPEGGSIFVSRNSGAGWSKNPQNFGNAVLAIAVDPFLDGVIYVVAGGLFRSTNDGVTWQSLGQPPDGVESLVADPVRPGHLYCSTFDGVVYRTIDGAQTWQPFSSGLEGFQARPLVVSADGRWLHAGTYGGGVFDLNLQSSYPCSPTSARLCLVGNRYAVELLAGRAGNAPSTPGVAQSLGDRAGYFALPFATGDPEAPEVVVKMLPQGTFGSSGAPVFYSSLTTLPYLLTLTDTVTGQTETYENQADAPFCGGVHIALAASEQAALRRATPKAETPTLQLLGGRFAVTLDAHRPGSSAAVHGAVIASGDRFGFFSLPEVSGDPEFPEIVVKMLDGRGVNGEFWFFYTGLTSLDYTLTVTDSETGEVQSYESARPFCGAADTRAFPAPGSGSWDYSTYSGGTREARHGLE